MKLKFLLLLLSLFVFNANVFALDVEGQGWGDTEADARREALLDMSSRISVLVRNRVKTTQEVNSKTLNKQSTERVSQRTERITETNSDLPILGAVFSSRKEGVQVLVTAQMESAKSLPLYEKRLKELQLKISKLNLNIANSKPSESQYHAIMDMLTLLDEFKKHNSVVLYLGGTLKDHGVDETKLQAQLRASTQQVDNLDLAATILAAGIDESGVYIYPATIRNSNEITAFGSRIKEKLAGHIKSVQNPRNKNYTLIGEYAETNDGISLTYYLQDSLGITQKTNSVQLSKKAYTGIETKPKTVDFETLLTSGVAISGNLHVDVKTGMGSRDLLFVEDEEVELWVKLSEMGYFYVVGHTVKDDENFSYLMEMNEGQGTRKFVKFVNADDANKWISIGKFAVTPPFGVEGLQVIASNKDLANGIPPIQYDGTTGLYLVAPSSKEGIVRTRALVKKFPKTVQSSEASLVFTTRKKNN